MSSDKSEPDVSVLTPSYAYGRFIKDALESVARQEGVAAEHIVQDAGSQDGTIDTLRAYGDRVRWRSEPDRGQSDALNRAFRSARGRWIAWLNADEFYFPGGLRALIDAGEKVGADVVFGDTVFIDAEGKFLRLVPQHRYSALLLRHYGVYIGSCATVFRRSILGSDRWDEEIRRVMDSVSTSGSTRKGHASGMFPTRSLGTGPTMRRSRHNPQNNSLPIDRRCERGTDPRATPEAARSCAAFFLQARVGCLRETVQGARTAGTDLRWCRPEVGPEGFFELLRTCYGIRR